MILRSIREQHPFTYARERFLAGELTVAQAIAMAERDNDFAYEALMAGKTAHDAAESVVREVWCKELVRITQNRKRGLALLQEDMAERIDELDSVPFSSSDQLYRMWLINNQT